MSELPEGWALATLGEVITPGGLFDGPFGSSLKTEDYTDHGVRVIRLENVANLRFIADKHAYISHEKYAQLLRHTVGEGDIIFGSFVESSTRVCMLPKLETPAIAKADCFTIRAAQATVLPQFLLFQLGSDRIRRQFQQDIHGATRPRVSLRDIRDCIIALPPLAEQKRIVAKIDELTAQSRRAKEELDAIPALLDQLRQSILAAAFRGDLTADWRAQNPDVEPAEQLLERIRAERREVWLASQTQKMAEKGKSPLRETLLEKYREPEILDGEDVPASWAVACTELVGDVLLGRRRAGEEYVDGKEGRSLYPYLRVANVKEDRLVFDDVLEMPFNDQELRLYRLQPGDIILSEGQSPELVGQSAIFEGGWDDLCIQATVHRFRAYSFATTSAFAQLVFLHHLHSGRFQRAASLTTNIAHLTSERLRPIPFPVPPRAEQELIVERVRAVLNRIRSLRALHAESQAQLATLNQSILAKAFRGELVPQDPTDEPASVLLERIRAARASATPTAKPKRTRTPAPQPTQHQLELPTPTPTAAPTPAPKAAPRPRAALDAAALDAAIDSALWLRGPLEKDAAIRTIAEHLREAGLVEFQRLRSGSGLHAQIDDAIESAIAAGRLDRPKFGYVRACKADAQAYSSDDWRAVLVASLGPEPTLREDAIRSAAEWAREHTGLAFVRLRSDGHIVEGLRSAINGAIRRNEVVRHDAKRISRSPGA